MLPACYCGDDASVHVVLRAAADIRGDEVRSNNLQDVGVRHGGVIEPRSIDQDDGVSVHCEWDRRLHFVRTAL